MKKFLVITFLILTSTIVVCSIITAHPDDDKIYNDLYNQLPEGRIKRKCLKRPNSLSCKSIAEICNAAEQLALLYRVSQDKNLEVEYNLSAFNKEQIEPTIENMLKPYVEYIESCTRNKGIASASLEHNELTSITQHILQDVQKRAASMEKERSASACREMNGRKSYSFIYTLFDAHEIYKKLSSKAAWHCYFGK